MFFQVSEDGKIKKIDQLIEEKEDLKSEILSVIMQQDIVQTLQ